MTDDDDAHTDTDTGIESNRTRTSNRDATDTPAPAQHGESASDRRSLSRRATLRGTAAVGMALAGLGTVGSFSEPAQASDAIVSEITAEDTAVTNNDGTVHAVYLEPELTVEWQHFGDGVNAVDILIRITVDETSSTIYQELLTHEDAGDRVKITDTSDSFDAVSGSIDLAFDRVDITDAADGIDESDFSDGSIAAGDSETTTVEVLVNAVIDGNDGEHETIDIGRAFDVTVTNPDGEAGVNGSMNTDAE